MAETPGSAAQPIQGYCGDCNKPTDTLPCPHCSGTATVPADQPGSAATAEVDLCAGQTREGQL